MARLFSVVSTFMTLCLLAGAALAADFTAAVDRTRLASDETLTLTLTFSGQSLASPDLSPLAGDFDILSQQTNSQLAFGFGTDSSSTDWVIALGPKRTGTLTIPAFSFQGQTTRPIAITVTAPDKQSASGEALFLTAELDRASAPVQSQVLLTLRLHTAVNLASVDVPDLQLPGVNVLKIHDSQYRKHIDGRDYQILEIRYALFAEAPGTLTIPPLAVTGVVPAANDPFAGSSLFGPRGKPVRLLSEELHLKVTPIPQQAKGHPWLPARGLSLSQSWSRKPDEVRVGEPVTRTITLTAQGLTGAQIPPLATPELTAVKHYPDQPELGETLSADGVLGSRVESVALVPTQPGRLTLPPVAVSWWDTANNRMETTQLEAVTLEVLPALEEEPASSSVETSAAAGGDAAVPPTDRSALHLVGFNRWFQASLILNALLLVALAVLLRHPSPRPLQRSRGATPAVAPTGETAAFSRLQATPDQDMTALRANLLAWAREFWPDRRVATLTDVITLSGDVQLADLFTRMDKSLYGSQRDEAPAGSAIKAAVKAIRRTHASTPASTPALKPLYPRH